MAAAWVLLQLVASATAVQAQPGIISPPPAVTAIPLSSSRIKLSWNAATNTSIITAYRMYRNNTLVTTVAGTARTYTDTGLAAAVTYAYQIQTATSGKVCQVLARCKLLQGEALDLKRMFCGTWCHPLLLHCWWPLHSCHRLLGYKPAQLSWGSAGYSLQICASETSKGTTHCPCTCPTKGAPAGVILPGSA